MFLDLVKLDPGDIVAEIEDLLRTIPDLGRNWDDDEAVDWLGRARAILTLNQLGIAAEAMIAVGQASTSNARDSWNGKRPFESS